MTSSLHGDRRRLSGVRVVIAIVVLAGLAVGSFFGYQTWSSAQAEVSQKPWFAGYVDVTATPTFKFEDGKTASTRDVMLSFIVADKKNGCTPTWGTAYNLDEAAENLDLDRRVARLVQRGGGVGISFGGLINDELSSVCTDHTQLVDAYASVLDRYKATTIDLDIEGENLSNTVAGERRADAIAALQKQRRADNKPLAVWLTLPVATFGLTDDGANAVSQMLAAGVDIAGVNAMTMDFGGSLDKGESQSDASIRALNSTHRQLSTLYKRAKISLSDATIWSKIGATPMIGQNDVPKEVFSLKDAKTLNKFALDRNLGRMSMWSLNRDLTCGPNYVDLKRVSDSCSGIDQGDAFFSDLLGNGFKGTPMKAAGKVTTAEPVDANVADDPATSPYPIWAEDSSYLKGTKVVWHRNVYEAKWWTSGDLPDDPVLHEWQTPWTLVGPVLAGEKPHQLDTLAYELYPQWAGTSQYDKGSRVNFDGVPFEAKWWTQGDSPAAASSAPDSSPWVPLTAAQVKEAEAKLAATQQADPGTPAPETAPAP